MKTPSSIRLGNFVTRLLLAVLVLFVLAFMLTYVLMGTPSGSAWILQKIASETGISLKYGKGNLRDGIWVSDIEIGKNSDVSVTINQGFVKLGYRAVLTKQLHITKAEVDTITIYNKQPPTGEPFDYPRLALPVNLWLENVSVKKVAYDQKDGTPFSLNGIYLDYGKWVGSRATLKNAKLNVDELVFIDNVNGEIDLSGEYPLTANATVKVKDLDEHYISPFSVQATGSLKRTVGKIKSSYNDGAVQGDFVVQGLDEGVPFSANVAFEELVLPYADDQHITVSQGTIVGTGTIDDIELRLNTQLTAKDVPDGHYTARATLLPTKGMEIHTVTANTSDGVLMGKGKLDWQKQFFMTSEIASQNFHLKQAIPKDYQDYSDYLSERLNGRVGFDFGLKDEDDHLYYKIALNQHNGESINALIRQQNSTKKNNPNPYIIQADWKQYVRESLPDIGRFNSPHGQATIRVGETIFVDANAKIETLLDLPKGDYDAKLTIDDKDLDIQTANYQGEMGNLSAKGQVYLPDDGRNLSYRIVANTTGLSPNTLLKEPSPIQTLAGEMMVVGSLKTSNNTQIHDIAFSKANLTATTTDKQTVSLIGDGSLMATLMGDKVNHLSASYEGKLSTTNIHKAFETMDLKAKITGDLNTLTIEKLTTDSTLGKLSAGGTIRLNDGIGWRVAVHADEFDTSQLHQKSTLRLTGDILSEGLYKNDRLISASAKFDGKVGGDGVPAGAVSFDVLGTDKKFTINQFLYNGVEDELSATGFVDLTQGIVGDVSATLKNFDIGQFVKGHKGALTGQLSGFVNWQKDSQTINIKDININGELDGNEIVAKGKVMAQLELPDSPKAFFNSLKKTGFRLDIKKGAIYDNLTALGTELQDSLANTDKKIRRVIQTLNAEQLALKFGDNQFFIDGNESRLTLDIAANDLSVIYPVMRGEIVGGVILIGDDNSLPTIYSDLKISSISMPSFAIREGSVLAKVVNLGNGQSSLVAQGLNAVVAGKSFQKARLDFNGTLQNHNTAIYLNNGEMQVQSRLQGGLDESRYNGVVSEGRLQTRYGVLNQLQPAQVAYDFGQSRLSVAAHCWQSVSANARSVGTKGALCLKDSLHASGTAGDVNVVISNLDATVFRPILPSDLSFRGRLNGKIVASWQKNKSPHIDTVLYSENGELGLRQDGLPDTTMAYDRISVIAQSIPAGLKLRADIKAGRAGDGYIDVVLDPYKDEKAIPIAGALALNRINLGVLRPFFPAMRTLGGVVNLAGGVGGTLRNPEIFGNAILEEGRLALAEVPVSLTDIQMTAELRGKSASITGDFLSGQGKGNIAGEIDWQKDIQAKVTLKGDRLDVLKPPLLSAKVSPELELIVRPKSKYVDIKGVISVPAATIRPPETTNNVVGESDDVTVIDRRVVSNLDDILAKVEPWNINADIGMDLGDEVVFRGFGAKLPLAGAIHLTQTGQGVLRGRGVVQVSERTMVDIFGQSLELNYGQIRFNGNVSNPALSIMAARQIDGQTVSLRVTGTVANPLIKVFNDAGLSEQQAMNALVTGSLTEQGTTQVSEQSFRSQVTNNLAAAGLSLGLQGTRGITNDIGRALGFESLVVDASGNSSDTNVNVTGYINPDLYIRYGVGVFNAESTLSMRYQLTRRVYLEATKATENIVDVVYRWRF